MADSDAELMPLLRAIIADDGAAASRLLTESPELAGLRVRNGATRQSATEHYVQEIGHYIYGGDSALHVAAAAYRPGMIQLLVSKGAVVGARNRRGAEPLHYAADGMPGSRSWNPRAQAETITCLIAAGADPNATDNSGVTPLHRAVRTRCSAAVHALLDGGSDVRRTNSRGSTPMQLATRATGRGGTGSPESKSQQEEIVKQLHSYGAT